MRFGTYRLRKRLEREIIARSGLPARRVRNPNPLRAPWRAETLDLRRNGGLGDVLMCTPALREIKRSNPRCRIRFYTDFGELLRGLPYIDDVQPPDAAPAGSIYLEYEDSIPPRAHIARIIGDILGVKVSDTRPDCAVRPELVARFRAKWANETSPKIIILRRASSWTPNKDWPSDYWDELVARLLDWCRIIEVGFGTEATPRPRNLIDLRDRISLEELVAAVAAADLYVGPVSGPLHIAAAFGKPAVTIVGGYEAPINSAYPATIPMHSAPSCSPCWLRSPCPFQRKCLTAITPERVQAAVCAALASGNRPVGRSV